MVEVTTLGHQSVVPSTIRLGIDVGGTNTDAVAMDGPTLLARTKVPTTEDVTSGIFSALEEILNQIPAGRRPGAVMIGTTHFTNALVERKGLTPTAVLRLALPATTLLPPLIDWPAELSDAIGGFTFMAQGGHEFDGREISPLDRREIRNIAKQMRKDGVLAAAVCGVFSPVNPVHEQEAAVILEEEIPGIQVTMSHQNGRIGILERENASTINASLAGLATHTIGGIRVALEKQALSVPLYLTQNDGTLMDADFAAKFPVFTIASGPTNSMRGAAYLSGVRDGIVVDIGGSSTDVGALVNGFPREASVAMELGGVRTNFRMPDVLSIALGGGSVVRESGESGFVSIGPDSIGYRLTEDSQIFGGCTLTATDVAAASGLTQIGNPSLIRNLDTNLVSSAIREIKTQVEKTVDRMKTTMEPLPVILVGGGSILVDDDLNGASRVLRPAHADVANAIGAAMSQVGGQIEGVYTLDNMTREQALDAAKAEAVERAVHAGAAPGSVEIVEIDEIPLTYLPSNAILIRVKAAGELINVGN